MNYDSTDDTIKHIQNVREKLLLVIQELSDRAINHDKSKLIPPEKEVYDQYTPILGKLEYGSQAYKDTLKKMSIGVQHHWQNNRHHPEYFPNQIDGMNLIDLLEMLCDWKAAGERHPKDNIRKSIELNVERFHISEQLKQILLNTVEYMGWS